MKKTHSISIAQTLFNVEEDAYIALDAYLNSIKAHFAGNSDQDEIIRDIEARIAERFSELKHSIITLADVENVTKDMGNVNQFTESDSSSTESEKTETPKDGHRKRLYRNPDEAVIAGVASGLGYYFGIDAVIVRIIFVALCFGSGVGVLLYVILWFVMPEAKTASQKLEMRGDPVTLQTVSEIVKEKIDDANISAKGKTAFGKLLMIPVKILRALATVIQKVLFPSIRVIIGSIFAIAGFSVAVGATIAAGALLFGIPVSLIDPSIAGIVHSGLFYVALVFIYFTVLIPGILFFFKGLQILQRKRSITRKVTLSLLLVWFIALVGSGISGSRLVFRVQEMQATNPIYLPTDVVTQLEHFSKLSVANAEHVTLISGDAYSIDVHASQYDTRNLDVVVKDDTLYISRKNIFIHPCFLCFAGPVVITVTVPMLSDISIHDASRVDGTFVSAEALSLTVSDASSAVLETFPKNLTVSMKDASSIRLSGTGNSLDLTLSDASSFHGENFAAHTAVVHVSDASSARVRADKTLSVTARDASSVRYYGDPAITKDLSDFSSLKKADSTLPVDENN